jgi:thiamine-phosphate pyrophosphorylase
LHQGTGFFLSIKRDVLLGKALGAQGLHLGGGPFDPELVAHARREGLVVSAAAHSEADLRDATRLGISAVLVSPIFAVPGKGPERGLGALTEARRLAPDAAVFALGGITPATAAACYEAGAHGIAVQRALLDATDPVAAARALLPREIAEHDLRSSSPL